MSAMLELDELVPILGGNYMRPGRTQADVIPIPKTLAFGRARLILLLNINAAFWASPGTLPGCPNP